MSDRGGRRFHWRWLPPSQQPGRRSPPAHPRPHRPPRLHHHHRWAVYGARREAALPLVQAGGPPLRRTPARRADPAPGRGVGAGRKGIADIAAVPAGLRRSFSQRRAEIEAHLEERGHSSARAAQVATYATRRTAKGQESPEQPGPALGCETAIDNALPRARRGPDAERVAPAPRLPVKGGHGGPTHRGAAGRQERQALPQRRGVASHQRCASRTHVATGAVEDLDVAQTGVEGSVKRMTTAAGAWGRRHPVLGWRSAGWRGRRRAREKNSAPTTTATGPSARRHHSPMSRSSLGR